MTRPPSAPPKVYVLIDVNGVVRDASAIPFDDWCLVEWRRRQLTYVLAPTRKRRKRGGGK